MPNLFLLFSHKLTDEQLSDARTSLEIDDFYYLSEELQTIWSNISPIGNLDIEKLSLIEKWLLDKSNPKDYVLVQGDFGATFYFVDFCFRNNLVPIYSTTKRESKEIKSNNGTVEKTLIFKHINFRKYRRYKDE